MFSFDFFVEETRKIQTDLWGHSEREYRACGRDVAPHSRVPQISVNGGTHSMYADGEGVGVGRGGAGWVAGIKGNDVNRL